MVNFPFAAYRRILRDVLPIVLAGAFSFSNVVMFVMMGRVATGDLVVL